MSGMQEMLGRMSLDQLKALHRACKTKGYAFFRHPKDVITLREEIERREKAEARKAARVEARKEARRQA